MRIGMARALGIAAACLWLAGCNAANNKSSNPLGLESEGTDSFAAMPPSAESRTEVPPPLGVSAATEPGLLGSDLADDLNTGKKYYRAGNYGMAERHFRRAAELHPRDAEVWLGLAASYDRLRRFDLADRAYAQATLIAGPTIEIINNQAYSYMLRGDTKGARAKLLAAQRKAPENKYVQNNLRLLEASVRQGKAVE